MGGEEGRRLAPAGGGHVAPKRHTGAGIETRLCHQITADAVGLALVGSVAAMCSACSKRVRRVMSRCSGRVSNVRVATRSRLV
jgi:hypothetical protein